MENFWQEQQGQYGGQTFSAPGIFQQPQISYNSIF
jgi:hypothetical protein